MGDILFVLGAPRSGTTLVNRLLLEYFDFGMGPEGHWIVPYAERLSDYGDLSDEDWWWFNVRMSNTEPLLRLNLEARRQETRDARRDELVALLS